MAAWNYSNLKVAIRGRVAVVEINRTRVRNALSNATMNELGDVFDRFRGESQVGAVVLTGSGEKAFAAGADLREIAELNAISGRQRALRGQAVLESISDCPKPVIAAVKGYCLGGGLELALACHLRVAAEKALFGLPEVKLGLIPGYGGTQRLPRLIGSGRALQLLLTGETIDAREAERIGLVNCVVPQAQLLSHAFDLAERMTGKAPLALGLAIQAVNSGADLTLREALSLEAALFGLACATEDMKEGTAAFTEKRKPDFHGR